MFVLYIFCASEISLATLLKCCDILAHYLLWLNKVFYTKRMQLHTKHISQNAEHSLSI